MRWGLLILATVGTLSNANLSRAAEFPYVGIVNSNDVYVRSGPGKNYYPTDKLQKSEKVEIYRHDPGGWCAIRPPRNSFSWVSARNVEAMGHGLASATSDRVVVRVGSVFSEVRDVIQVRLDKGEKVELLGTAENSGGPWYKISPPSGEFRWIYNQFIDREDGETVVETELPTEPDAVTAGGAGASKSKVELASGEEQSGPELSSGFRPVAKSTPTLRSASNTPLLEGKLSEAEIQKHLEELDQELSTMVSEEVTVWSFADLRARGEKCLDDAPTALTRGRVRVFLNKMARFEDIKSRHDDVATTQSGTDLKNKQLGDVNGLERSDKQRFDGVGRLSPVVAHKVGYPQFALVNNRGEVVMFVNPAPGVNLRPFLNREVGVNGQRSYMAKLQKQQIDVQHVALLPDKKR